jgi:hypothetical protein
MRLFNRKVGRHSAVLTVTAIVLAGCAASPSSSTVVITVIIPSSSLGTSASGDDGLDETEQGACGRA